MRVGFIGVGTMGGAMARRALEVGLEVVVFDVNEDVTAVLAKLGAKVARSARDLAENVDVACVVVLSDEQVRTVVCGEDGLLSAERDTLDIIIHSTIHVPTLLEVAERARQRGFTLFDAGVSGSVHGAESGQIAVMVGGEEADIERCKPVLEAYGGLVMRVGPLGSGLKCKIARNLVSFAQCAAIYEGLRLAEEAEVDLAAFAQIVRHSEGLSGMVDGFLSTPSVHEGNLETPEGKQRLATAKVVVETALKDLSAAIDLGKAMDLRLPICEAAHEEVAATWGAEPGPRL